MAAKGASSGGTHARRTDTSDPHRSRSRALMILFQADVRGETPTQALDRADGDPEAAAILDDLDPAWGADASAEAPTSRPAAPLDDFTRTLVRGVHGHLDDLDATIGRFARRWSVSRMPVIDRNVLRLATFELMHEDTPPAIVISEALELAKSLSTDKSGRYVNGVLESIRRHREEDPA